MYMAQAEIISDVIEEHFDEAAFLYQSRLQALASHRIGLSAFRRIEQRLLAHLDGLLVGGEMAWRLVEPNLQGPTRAAVAIAAYVACGLGEDPYIEQLYAVLRDAPSPIFCGVRDALRHTSSHDAVDSLSRWLYAAHPSLRAAAVDALSFRRAEIPLNVLTQLLADHSELVRQSAAQAVGRLRLRSLTPRLRELCEPIASRQERVLVFTQFRELTAPLAEFLRGVFGQPGLVLSGETPVKDRPALVQAFQKELGSPFFVLSLKAGGTGLNLTAASHVIHFDRWWNPAVESQASDRAYRIGQQKNVLIHKFVCRGTVEERIDSLIAGKQELAHELLTGGGEALLTQLKDEELLRMVALDINSALPEG